MRFVYILGFISFILPKELISQEPIDLSIALGFEADLTAVSRAQINGKTATCVLTNAGTTEVQHVYIEYNYYMLPNIQTPALTLYSTPMTIPADTSIVITSEGPVFIGTEGAYQYSFSIKAEEEDLNITDNVVVKNIEIGTQTAKDDGISVATIGIGNGIYGEIGQVFKTQQKTQLDEVSIYLENITGVMTGEPVSINVYEFNEEGPQSLILESDTTWITASKNEWVKIHFPNTPLLEEGTYLITVVEYEKNLNLGMSATIYNPGSTWFRHDNLDWTDAQAFNFEKPFMIRPSLKSVCKASTTYISAESCEYYVSESGQNTWFESGVYQEIHPSYSFCDSIVEYDLTITKVDLNVQQSNEILIVSEEDADTYQWFDCNTGTLIQGATEQMFTAESNGSYQVLINKGSCSFFSDCYTVLTVGTLESDFKERIEIYPNPNDGFVNINMNELIKTLNISLVNLEGKIYMERIFQNTEMVSFAVDIPPGTYIVQLWDDRGRKASLKIIKQ